MFGLFAVCLLAFAAAGAVAFYVARVASAPQLEQPKPASYPPAVITPVQTPRTIVIYLPVKSKNGVYLAPVTKKVTSGPAVLDAAMTALLSASKSGEAANLIPSGARLRSPVMVKNGVAIVDFSREFVNNFSGGSDEEALTLNSIAHTLVNNSGGSVQRVQILVVGEKAESLGGHFDLGEPIVPDSALLRPDNP